jgi:phage tail sheath gpL-like
MSGTIEFINYPVSNRNPGVYIEIDATQANNAQVAQRTLIFGQMLSTGTALPNIPIISSGLASAATSFGLGSQLTAMLTRYLQSDPLAEVWCVPLADNGAGTAGTAIVTLTGPATAAGSLNVYVNGTVCQVKVNNGDTATVIATNLAAAINLQQAVPATAIAAAGVVTVTASNVGVSAGEMNIALNYIGPTNSELTPAGVALATVTTPGTDDPILTTAIGNLGNKTFDFIVNPYTGSASIAAVAAYLNETDGRWSPTIQLYGHSFSAMSTNFANAVAFGATVNDKHLSVLPINGQAEPSYLVAAAFAAACASSLRNDPALTLSTVPLNILAPSTNNEFTFAQQNSFLYAGLSTFRVNDAGQATLSRVVTTYQTNALGQPDSSWLDVNVPYQLMAVARTYQIQISTQFSRKILVDAGSRFSLSSNATTTIAITLACVAIYNGLIQQNLVGNAPFFAANVQADNQQNGLVALYLPVTLSGQLQIIAARVQFTQL